MPHWDPTINLGHILTAIGFAGALWIAAIKLFTRFDRRVSAFENILAIHAQMLTAQVARTEKHETILFEMAGNVQKVSGRLELWNLTFERLVVRFEKHEDLDTLRWEQHRAYLQSSVDALQASLGRMNQNLVGHLGTNAER